MTFFSLSLVGLMLVNPVDAGEVVILGADLTHQGNSIWSLNVTLKHEDTGWDHYADNWRLVDAQGLVLGERVLFHPHVNEQPFTRSLNAIKIPEITVRQGDILYIEAHDKRHGWTDNRLSLDLSQVKNGHLKVVY